RDRPGSTALPGFGLDRVLAQGQWKDQVLDLRTQRVDPPRASVEGKLQVRVAEQAGSGNLKLAMPGAEAQVDARMAPTQGTGELKARIDDTEAVQRWIESLPEMAGLFAGRAAKGSARLDASWQGGWQNFQRRLQNPAAPLARGNAEPSLGTVRLAFRL
ncbi:translocation/assembly module TamB, partial [Variovorax sp. CT11-76]